MALNKKQAIAEMYRAKIEYAFKVSFKKHWEILFFGAPQNETSKGSLRCPSKGKALPKTPKGDK